MKRFFELTLFWTLALWIRDELTRSAVDADCSTTRQERFRYTLLQWWNFSLWWQLGHVFMLWLGKITARAAIAAIKVTNRSRHNGLAYDLRELANRYDTRPRDVP